MVRDEDVFVAERFRRRGHLLDAGVAVGSAGVHLQVAANFLELHQLRQAALFRGLNLAKVLPDFGRNQIQAQLLVNLFFRFRRDDAFTVKQSVLAQLPAAALGAVAERHVVFLRAGKIHERRSIGLALEHPYVHLHLVFELDADLVLSLGKHLGDARIARHMFGDGGRVPPYDQKVQVPDGFSAPAERSRRGHFFHRLVPAQVL